jgi:hypothetical protein
VTLLRNRLDHRGQRRHAQQVVGVNLVLETPQVAVDCPLEHEGLRRAEPARIERLPHGRNHAADGFDGQTLRPQERVERRVPRHEAANQLGVGCEEDVCARRRSRFRRGRLTGAAGRHDEGQNPAKP